MSHSSHNRSLRRHVDKDSLTHTRRRSVQMRYKSHFIQAITAQRHARQKHRAVHMHLNPSFSFLNHMHWIDAKTTQQHAAVVSKLYSAQHRRRAIIVVK